MLKGTITLTFSGRQALVYASIALCHRHYVLGKAMAETRGLVVGAKAELAA